MARKYQTDKKEKKIFLVYKELQMGVVAKSYNEEGLPNIRGNAQIFSHTVYEEAVSHMTLQPFPSGFPYVYEKNFLSLFYLVYLSL
jgi:hypothetical protein